MLEIIGVIVTVIAVAGVILNTRKVKWCFVLWIVSNLLSAFIHFYTGPWSLVVRDIIFLVLAVEGWKTWSSLEAENDR